MFASVQTCPVGDNARPPRFRQRDASGMSAVTQMSAGPIRSAIQSSAASGFASTITGRTLGRPLGRMGRDPLLTRWTGRLSRVATRKVSSRTGQASASI